MPFLVPSHLPANCRLGYVCLNFLLRAVSLIPFLPTLLSSLSFITDYGDYLYKNLLHQVCGVFTTPGYRDRLMLVATRPSHLWSCGAAQTMRVVDLGITQHWS